jgi:hypothetical protein
MGGGYDISWHRQQFEILLATPTKTKEVRMSATTYQRPLPTVVGPTENALRALLMQLLATTPLDSYEQWAVLNLVDRHSGDDKALVDVVVEGLVVDDTEARTILRTLDDRGLLHRVNGAWRPSPVGADLLSLERQRVAAVTARLLDGIAATDLVTAVRVLDQVRERAQEERTRLL